MLESGEVPVSRRVNVMVIPVPGGDPFVTDAGLETDLLFLRGFDLPEFAAFPLLEDDGGLAAFDSYYRDFAAIAESAKASLVLASPTWRANPDWGAKLGYDTKALDRMNQLGIKLMRDLKASLSGPDHIAISGIIGPRGDGYIAGDVPDLQEAEAYHRPQIESFATAGADIAEAITMTSANEAGGVVLAANSIGLPVAILFTVETDGRLPDGTSLRTAVERTGAQIKIEVTPVSRGCAYEPELRSVDGLPSKREFGFAEMQVVSFADLYAGKIVAALDRQHPRDLVRCAPAALA